MENIDKLEGRELDAAVAEARGWRKFWDEELEEWLWDTWTCKELPDGSTHCSGCQTTLPHFSTDIASAWELVEEMREAGWIYKAWGCKENGWDEATFWRYVDKRTGEAKNLADIPLYQSQEQVGRARHPQIETAIARAYRKALKAKEA